MSYNKRGVDYLANLSTKDVLSEFESSLSGLPHNVAEKRIREFGYNTIAEKKEIHIILEFLSYFKSPLVIILVIALVVSAIFGGVINSIIIGVMILLSVTLNFFLERNAQKASEKLKQQVQTKVIVIRDGERKEIPSTHLCEGDVIFLNAGNLVPADCRIIEAKDFFINQSALTGESFPCEKTATEKAAKNKPILELNTIAFCGTNVVTGSATAIVIKTGKDTEFGKISTQLTAAAPVTEFEHGITKFGFLIMKSVFFLVLFIFLFNALLKHNVLESFLFALAVAVGITPELLPMIMSVTMAKGSLDMSKKGVIVKRLSAIPDFGSMDVLCTDKTGTLTEDKIELVKYTDAIGHESKNVLQYAYLNSFYQTGIKNPLDDAVLKFELHKLPKSTINEYKKVDEIPFDFVRKKMSVVVSYKKHDYLITKGAPEEIFHACVNYECNNKISKMTASAKKKITKQYLALSSQGYRVLAVALKRIKPKKEYTKHDETEMILLGFVSFFDPPKHDVKEVIKDLNNIGVEVKIITGDNEYVTKKVCSELNITVKGILLGNEIDDMTDDALRVRVEKTTIFARFSPDEKNRIIHALKANGHVVGYMGDGINDAPSLKTADVGISVNSAVDVAKESAAIVLTKKSLRVLCDGILEGRKTFSNTMKYIMMNLSSNFGNMFSVAGAVLFLPFLPMMPIQILLNNFIYDVSQITIPSDTVDSELIKKPRRWNVTFIRNFMLYFGPISSIFDFLTFIVLWKVFNLSASMFQTGWFMESLATQTLVIYIIRTKQFPLKSIPSKPIIITTLLCLAAGWILPYTIVGHWFGLVPLPSYLLIIIGCIVATYLVVVELVKRLFYKWHDM